MFKPFTRCFVAILVWYEAIAMPKSGHFMQYFSTKQQCMVPTSFQFFTPYCCTLLARAMVALYLPNPWLLPSRDLGPLPKNPLFTTPISHMRGGVPSFTIFTIACYVILPCQEFKQKL
jgi:hypothetical protein